jgi:acyl dehydratase
MTYFFEDFPVGETSEYGAYRVTREAIVAFARQFDPQPFHSRQNTAASYFSAISFIRRSEHPATLIAKTFRLALGFLRRSQRVLHRLVIE